MKIEVNIPLSHHSYTLTHAYRTESIRLSFSLLYSDEGTEPPRIHVESGDGECKFWLSPVLLAKNRGMSAVDIRKVERLVFEHQTLFLEKYDEFQSE